MLNLIFFSFESVLSSDNADSNKKILNDKLQQIDSPYFQVANCISIFEKLNKDNFFILHLDMRSLNADIEISWEFLTSVNENFSAIVFMESWCDETANENCLLNLDNYFTKQERIKKVAAFAFIYTDS